jgi:hypothetical protein
MMFHKEITMRLMLRLAPFLIVGMMTALGASTGEAQQFYAGGFRVFGCPPLDTLTYHGTGSSQQAECTSYQTGLVTGAAVPIEAWVATQTGGGVTGQNEGLQRQLDELTARVQALEAALSRSRPGTAPK